MPNQPLDGEPNAIKKGARIVILGAGPAGLHMASRLKQLGCTNVTILERTFRYGGKTHTVHEHGNPNDIGTCWMHPGYGPVIELIRKYDRAAVRRGGRASCGRRRGQARRLQCVGARRGRGRHTARVDAQPHARPVAAGASGGVKVGLVG